ncbi:MAG TPA: hypothetical protein VN722_04530 [Hanamia sp.]|nr:hypothetical protein [Hanamia sp.]
MNKLFLKRLCIAILLFLLTPLARAQSATSNIDETMRSHDKIYVVMTVCIVILVVFFLYLIRIDNKVSKKEKSA